MTFAFLPYLSLCLVATSLAGVDYSTNRVTSVIMGRGYVLEELETGSEVDAHWEPVREMSMEDGLVVTVNPNLVFPDLPALPGPESVTAEVAIAVLEAARDSGIDCFEQEDEHGVPYTTQPVIPIWTWEGFLGEDESNGWTRVAKKAAYDWYLNFIATNRIEGSEEQTNLAWIAISQCEELKYTNAWPALAAIVRNPFASDRDEAGRLAITYAPVGQAFYGLGLDVFTNGVPLAVKERGVVVDTFADRLQLIIDGTETNAIRCLYGRRNGECESAMWLDRLFVSRIQGYEVSSNRLVTALSVLANQNSWEFQNNYFEDITNRLMNASQPLPFVPELLFP